MADDTARSVDKGQRARSHQLGHEESEFPQIAQHAALREQGRKRNERGSGSTTGTHAEAVWAEMQNTLEEVELSASGGANAFSAEHGKALEELRKAQISLAKAWTRSEVEDDHEGEDAGASGEDGEAKSRVALGAGRILGNNGTRHTEDEQSHAGNPGGGHARPQSLAEETVNDILLARKRREANDRYFDQVNKGVIDVVEKLDVVATKMRGVELEAQDLWDSQSSLDTMSQT